MRTVLVRLSAKASLVTGSCRMGAYLHLVFGAGAMSNGGNASKIGRIGLAVCSNEHGAR